MKKMDYIFYKKKKQNNNNKTKHKNKYLNV